MVMGHIGFSTCWAVYSDFCTLSFHVDPEVEKRTWAWLCIGSNWKRCLISALYYHAVIYTQLCCKLAFIGLWLQVSCRVGSGDSEMRMAPYLLLSTHGFTGERVFTGTAYCNIKLLLTGKGAEHSESSQERYLISLISILSECFWGGHTQSDQQGPVKVCLMKARTAGRIKFKEWG